MLGIVWNFFLMAAVMASFIGLLSILLRSRTWKDDGKGKYTYDQLCTDTKDMIDRIVGADFQGLGLSEKELKNQRGQRDIISNNVRKCCSGDDGARNAVRELVKNYLSKDRDVNEDTIQNAIPFRTPQSMTARAMAEALIFYLGKGRDEGFSVLCSDYGWALPAVDKDGNEVYEVTEDKVRETWRRVRPELSYAQQLRVLSQMIYADTFGLGVIDELNAQKGSIEEIQIGLAGQQEKFYDYRSELLKEKDRKAIAYSKDSIHVLVHGTTIRLKYISFATDNEQQRVMRNLIMGSNSGELTVSRPSAVVDTLDGRRISVARPSLSDAWVGFVRKFDAVQKKSLDDWCSDMHHGKRLALLLRHLIRAKSSIGITGEMEAGKTTVLRACLYETSPDQNIRVVEADSFEVGARRFLPERNTLAVRVTPENPEEEVLAFLRKTTGHIFCVGEITAPSMANLTMNLAKIAQQIIFSAHYITTEDMVADFTNARLSIGGYTDEKLAEMDAVRALGFNVHIRKYKGVRYVQYIDEIVPEFDSMRGCDNEEVTERNAPEKIAVGIREVRTQLGRVRTYGINRIFEYDITTNESKVGCPTEACFERAKYCLSPSQYDEFVGFFHGGVANG